MGVCECVRLPVSGNTHIDVLNVFACAPWRCLCTSAQTLVCVSCFNELGRVEGS